MLITCTSYFSDTDDRISQAIENYGQASEFAQRFSVLKKFQNFIRKFLNFANFYPTAWVDQLFSYPWQPGTSQEGSYDTAEAAPKKPAAAPKKPPPKAPTTAKAAPKKKPTK